MSSYHNTTLKDKCNNNSKVNLIMTWYLRKKHLRFINFLYS